MENNESLALRVVNESLKLPIVKVNRSEFLVKVFGDKVEDVNQLIEEGPQAFLSIDDLDRAANNRIYSIVAQSSTLSFATGLPGGIAMAATIPADITQFYGYSLKLAQEVSYIYGYEDIWNQQGELSKEAKETLILYLGIMLGVSTASSAVRVLSGKLSVQALKKIPQKSINKNHLLSSNKESTCSIWDQTNKSNICKRCFQNGACCRWCSIRRFELFFNETDGYKTKK